MTYPQLQLLSEMAQIGTLRTCWSLGPAGTWGTVPWQMRHSGHENERLGETLCHLLKEIPFSKIGARATCPPGRVPAESPACLTFIPAPERRTVPVGYEATSS